MYNVGNGKVVENLDTRLGSLEEKMSLIDSKLSLLTDDSSNNKRGKTSRNNKFSFQQPFSTSPAPSPLEELKQAASEPEPQTILASPMVDPSTATRAPRRLFSAAGSGKGLDGDAEAIVANQLIEDVGAVKESVTRVEARLSALTGVMWPKIGFLIKSVAEIHEAIIEDGATALSSQVRKNANRFSKYIIYSWYTFYFIR